MNHIDLWWPHWRVDVQIDLDGHSLSVFTSPPGGGGVVPALCVYNLRRRLRKGEVLVPVVGVVSGERGYAELLPLAREGLAPDPHTPAAGNPVAKM